jgi:hypothetical protein
MLFRRILAVTLATLLALGSGTAGARTTYARKQAFTPRTLNLASQGYQAQAGKVCAEVAKIHLNTAQQQELQQLFQNDPTLPEKVGILLKEMFLHVLQTSSGDIYSALHEIIRDPNFYVGLVTPAAITFASCLTPAGAAIALGVGVFFDIGDLWTFGKKFIAAVKELSRVNTNQEVKQLAQKFAGDNHDLVISALSTLAGAIVGGPMATAGKKLAGALKRKRSLSGPRNAASTAAAEPPAPLDKPQPKPRKQNSGGENAAPEVASRRGRLNRGGGPNLTSSPSQGGSENGAPKEPLAPPADSGDSSAKPEVTPPDPGQGEAPAEQPVPGQRPSKPRPGYYALEDAFGSLETKKTTTGISYLIFKRTTRNYYGESGTALVHLTGYEKLENQIGYDQWGLIEQLTQNAAAFARDDISLIVDFGGKPPQDTRPMVRFVAGQKSKTEIKDLSDYLFRTGGLRPEWDSDHLTFRVQLPEEDPYLREITARLGTEEKQRRSFQQDLPLNDKKIKATEAFLKPLFQPEGLPRYLHARLLVNMSAVFGSDFDPQALERHFNPPGNESFQVSYKDALLALSQENAVITERDGSSKFAFSFKFIEKPSGRVITTATRTITREPSGAITWRNNQFYRPGGNDLENNPGIGLTLYSRTESFLRELTARLPEPAKELSSIRLTAKNDGFYPGLKGTLLWSKHYYDATEPAEISHLLSKYEAETRKLSDLRAAEKYPAELARVNFPTDELAIALQKLREADQIYLFNLVKLGVQVTEDQAAAFLKLNKKQLDQDFKRIFNQKGTVDLGEILMVLLSHKIDMVNYFNQTSGRAGHLNELRRGYYDRQGRSTPSSTNANPGN